MPDLFRLSWYGHGMGRLPGQRLRLEVVLKRRHVGCFVHCQYRKLHRLLHQWTIEQFGGARHFPLVSSLLIGHRGHMEQKHWDVLKATGTIHLVAISGLHLGLIALGQGFCAGDCC